ncbi:hypothetical protein Aduo_015308 [Ancylostoma duodenale]
MEDGPDTSDTSGMESYLDDHRGWISPERGSPSGNSSDAGTFLFYPDIDGDDLNEDDKVSVLPLGMHNSSNTFPLFS